MRLESVLHLEGCWYDCLIDLGGGFIAILHFLCLLLQDFINLRGCLHFAVCILSIFWFLNRLANNFF